MWIVVEQLLLGKDLVVLCQVFDDFYIEAVFHDEVACPRSLCVASALVYRLQHRETVFLSAVVVVLTESRRSMYDTCSIIYGNIVHACYVECFLVRLAERHELVIFPILHVFAFEFFKHFVIACPKDFVREVLRQIENITLIVALEHLYFDVIYVRSYCKSNV